MIRKILYILFLIFLSSAVDAQYLRTTFKARSGTKKIFYSSGKTEKKVYADSKLDIVQYKLFDQNANGVIEKQERGNIEIKISNSGEGSARDVKVKVVLLNDNLPGLWYERELFLGNIYPGEVRDAIVPIRGTDELITDVAHFKIELEDRFSSYVEPVEVKIGTNQYQYPNIQLFDAVFSTDNGSVLFNYPVYLRLYLENKGQNTIQDIEGEVVFESDECVALSNEKFIISGVKSGDIVVKEIIFTTKANYPYDIIPVKIHLHDKANMYSETKSLYLDLSKPVAQRKSNDLNLHNNFQSKMLIADVDTGIPVDTVKYLNKYALIIGNEDYSKHRPNLSYESNVVYARNDAVIFREYAIKSLGIPEKNTFLLLNGTYAEMIHEIERVSKILERSTEEVELIFYYAGHGLPDENTRTPYIIPVDVSPINLGSAIKLTDIYKRLGGTEAEKITFFIDACFTGGGRESGLLAGTRAFTVEPKYSTLNGNIVVFNSSSGIQSSLPFHEKQHGMFTYFLLKKLKETKGNLTYGELAEYLKNNVSLESLRINAKEQDPKVNVGIDVRDTWMTWNF